MTLAERLSQKGWSAAEIEHALHHLAFAEQRKHPFVKLADVGTYWLLVFSVVLGVGALVKFVFPVLLLFPFIVGAVFTVLAAVVFGVLFSHVFRDIYDIRAKQHLLILFAVPLTSFSVTLMVLGRGWMLPLLFSLAFIALYVYWWVQ